VSAKKIALVKNAQIVSLCSLFARVVVVLIVLSIDCFLFPTPFSAVLDYEQI
jgi:hypothetical protein